MAEKTKMAREEFAVYANPCPKKDPADVRNLQYYLQYWNYFEDNKWFQSWNWAAFFLGPFWFFYRRMYVYGIGALCFVTLFGMAGLITTAWWVERVADVLPEGNLSPFIFFCACFAMLTPAFILSWGSAALVALYANAFYFNHTEWWLKRHPADKPGVNRWLPWGVGVLLFILFFLAGAYQSHQETLRQQEAFEARTGQSQPMPLLPEGFSDESSESVA